MSKGVYTDRPDGSRIDVALYQLKGEYDDLLKLNIHLVVTAIPNIIPRNRISFL